METTKPHNILNFNREELATHLSTNFGLEPYRSIQLFRWLYKEKANSFEVMSDIAKQTRGLLAETHSIFRPRLASVQQSIDGTRKYLFTMEDGSSVETVLIKQPKRYTLCISSQVGCAIGCKFCRTGLMGLKRHLETYEIISQVLAVKDDIDIINKENNEEIDFANIVFMGMGEPFHNFENVYRAITILGDQYGFYFSPRKVTVSTSGLVPKIKEFGERGAPASLAISLNATTNIVRDAVIPINKKWPLEMLLETLRNYPATKRKSITMEYVMLHEVNDTPDDLKRLPQLLKGMHAKLNLIPYNDNTGLPFKSPPKKWVDTWQRSLNERGINTRVRWSKGMDISAACGQLATEKSVIQ
jgi:23S rRNA (adenine2503-C2)-methyltransferase